MRITGIKRYLRNVYYYKVRPIFYDMNKRVRKQIPRTFAETDNMFRNVSFALIIDFYENQFIEGQVDWTYTKEHENAANWLKLAYKYITEHRPLLNDLNEEFLDSYDFDDLLAYNEENRKVNQMMHELEELIDALDSTILHGLVTYRFYLWT